MQRGLFNFPFPTGRNVVQPVIASAGSFSTINGNGAMKASIILFDFNPGTRTFTVPPGVYRIRVAVVGGAGGQRGSGGGYTEDVYNVQPGQTFTYTVGASGLGATPTAGGTSSWNSVLSATGGAANAGAAGVGSGGAINTSGGVGGSSGGGASGHRYGNGQAGGLSGGGGWGMPGAVSGGDAFVDGWGLGLIPGNGGSGTYTTTGGSIVSGSGGYGAGGGGDNAGDGNVAGSGGMGGGGGGSGGSAGVRGGRGGIGGGGGQGQSTHGDGGPGCVIVEVLG